MSRIIGLTGPTGSGKSYASLIAKNYSNIKIVDCDVLSREAVKKGSPGLAALVNAFSSGILKSDGSLNRRELARRAFSSKENTELLNKTLFPFISELVKAQLKDKKNILLDAPTLFESGLDEVCDKTIAVTASKEIRLARIIARDNLTNEDAIIRMNAGKPDDFYKERADYIIYNNGNLTDFTTEFCNVLKTITEE